jgi:microcystin-dependent protein
MQYSNRELSQFAYFLKVNDVTQKIAITTTATPFVGIGSTNPTEKLDVFGNIKASGIVSATAYYGNGATLSNVTAVVNGYFVSEPSGIWTGSSVGIGTSVFTHKLNVNGNIKARAFYSDVSTGTPPFTVTSTTLVDNLNVELLNGREAPQGNIIGDSDEQTLTNKTFIIPIISQIRNNNAVVNLPTSNGTLIHTGAVGIITSGLYGSGSINNSHISVGASVSYSKLNLFNSIKSTDIDPNNKIRNNNLVNSTISGVSLGESLFNLSPGDYITGGNYNGSGIVTFSVRASTENIPNTLVARDGNGNISGINSGGVIPIGGIIMWVGVTIPVGWTLCDGTKGTPDLRERFIVGASYFGGDNNTVIGNGYVLGETGGSNSVTLDVSTMPWHDHYGSTDVDFPDHSHTYTTGADVRVPGTPNQQRTYVYNDRTVGTSGASNRHYHTIYGEGGNAPHENRPPFYALAFIMRIA